MSYEVKLTKKALNFYQKSDVALVKKIDRCLEVLEKTPFNHANIKPLKGKLKGRYRYRLGQYRIIYRVNSQSVTVEVLLIGPRGDVYGGG
ncbi:MAG: type II toxin-antitoxin system RelE/ParE family toxin [Cyanobacteria bacterium P01_A01_bin.116]